jgi:hypothetical protein
VLTTRRQPIPHGGIPPDTDDTPSPALVRLLDEAEAEERRPAPPPRDRRGRAVRCRAPSPTTNPGRLGAAASIFFNVGKLNWPPPRLPGWSPGSSPEGEEGRSCPAPTSLAEVEPGFVTRTRVAPPLW